MNWDAMGAIAEILGATAVFASLIYLAIQIRGNTNQSAAQMFQSTASEQSRVADAITGDPENFKVWLKMHAGEAMSAAETARALFIISRVVQAFLAIQIGHEKGQIDKEFFGDAKAQIKEMLGTDNARPLASKYLARQHPNLMRYEIFESLLS